MTNNSMSRRHFMKVTAMAGGALALAACTPAAAPGGAAPAAAGDAAAPAAPAADAAAPASDAAATTYWYGWGNLDPAMAKIVETAEFKEHMGDGKFEYKGSVNNEAIQTAIAAGTPPDGGSNFDYPNFFTRGAVIDVTDLVATSNIVKKENMLGWTWDYAFFGGKMIGIPGLESYVQLGLNYNADAAAKAGLDPDKPPTTWQETLDWHKALTKKDDAGNLLQIGLDPYDAMAGDTDFGPLSFGVTYWDENTREFNLDNEKVAESLNLMGEFFRVAGPDQFAAMRQVEGNGGWGAAYNAGIQTMIIEGYWHPGETQIQKPEIAQHNRASWAPVSDDRKDVKIQAVNAHFVQIFKEGKNQMGAFKLGEFFNTAPALDIIFKEVGWMHGITDWVKTVDANAYPGLKFYIDSANEATEWHLLRRCPIHWFVRDQMIALREQVYRDLMKPAEAAAELQKRALAEWEAQGLQ